MPSKRYGYDIEDFNSFADGAVPPPNFQSLHIDDAIRAIVCRPFLEPLAGSRRTMHPDGPAFPARYFLTMTQNGSLDGSGFVLFYDDPLARAATFAICVHEKVADRGANPQRGWNPGACGKCGLDMTTDSSG